MFIFYEDYICNNNIYKYLPSPQSQNKGNASCSSLFIVPCVASPFQYSSLLHYLLHKQYPHYFCEGLFLDLMFHHLCRIENEYVPMQPLNREIKQKPGSTPPWG